jgi:hypothetical protein
MKAQQAKTAVSRTPKKAVATRIPEPETVKIKKKAKVRPQVLHAPGTSSPILWRKTRGGTFVMGNGRKIRKGQTFLATINEIPKAFRDSIVPVNEFAEAVVVPQEEPPIEVDEPVFTIQELVAGSGLFEVLNVDGKVVSEGELTEAEAEELVKQLKG